MNPRRRRIAEGAVALATRADRVSFSLTAAQVTNLRAAVEHADKIGLPLNRMMTVHWEAAGVPAAMAKATGRLTDLLTKALTRHGSATAWLFVHETGDGKGGHCHLLAHVPASLADLVSRRQRSWLKRITGRPYKPRVILSRPIGGLLGLETGNPDLHAVNLAAALGYVIKGADSEAAEHLQHPETGTGRARDRQAVRHVSEHWTQGTKVMRWLNQRMTERNQRISATLS